MGAALIAGVVGFRTWLQSGARFPGDSYAIGHFAPYKSKGPVVSAVSSAYVRLGSPAVAAVVTAACVVVLYRLRGRRAAGGLALAAGVVIVTAVLKRVWGPTAFWARYVVNGGVNYPSGHAAYVTAVFGYLGIVAWRGGRRGRWLLPIPVVVIIGVGPALVVGGVHLISDAVAGYMLGLGWLLLVVTAVGSPEPPVTERRDALHGLAEPAGRVTTDHHAAARAADGKVGVVAASVRLGGSFGAR